MVNPEIAAAMKSLYNELINEIDSQNKGNPDFGVYTLADCIKNAVKTTHNKFCEPQDKIN